MNAIVCAHLAGRREVALVAAGEALEKGPQVGQLVARATLELASVPADVHQQPLVVALQAAHQELQSLAVGPEADDHQAGVREPGQDERPGCQKQVHALRDDQLADEGDHVGGAPGRSRPARRARRRRCRAVSYPRAHLGQLLRGGRRIAAGVAEPVDRLGGRVVEAGALRRVQPAHKPVELLGGAGRVTGNEGVDVDAGRPEECPLAQPLERHRCPQALRRMARADKHSACGAQALARVRARSARSWASVCTRAPSRAPSPRTAGPPSPAPARRVPSGGGSRSRPRCRPPPTTSRTAATLASM